MYVCVLYVCMCVCVRKHTHTLHMRARIHTPIHAHQCIEYNQANPHQSSGQEILVYCKEHIYNDNDTVPLKSNIDAPNHSDYSSLKATIVGVDGTNLLQAKLMKSSIEFLPLFG